MEQLRKIGFLWNSQWCEISHPTLLCGNNHEIKGRVRCIAPIPGEQIHAGL